jgi:hypothetical protein
VIASKLQQAHDDLARVTRAQRLIQALPSAAIRMRLVMAVPRFTRDSFMM